MFVSFSSLSVGRSRRAAGPESLCHKPIQKAFAVCKLLQDEEQTQRDILVQAATQRSRNVEACRSEGKGQDPENNWPG